MATLNINGHTVTVDDGFLKLSPDEQNATVDEIARSLASKSAPSILPEIGSGIANAVTSAGKSVADYLNPFSDARHASYASQAGAPLGDALKQNLAQITGTGSALATPVTAPGNVASAVLTPLVAHPFQALNNALGIDLPYDKAKAQAATALSGLAPRGFSPVGAKPIPAPLPTGAQAKSAATAVYTDPAIKALKIPTQDVTSLAAGKTNDLLNQGFRPTPESAPATFRELNSLSPAEPKPVDFWTRVEAEMNRQPIPTETQPITNVSVDDLRAARRALNKTAGLRDQQGNPTPDAAAATQAIGSIDDLLNNVSPALRTANANYSAGKSADTIDFRSMVAARRANKTGSGSNIENTMRQEVDKIPNRGLSPDAQALRDIIVNGTRTRNLLRKVGKLGFGDGLSLMYHAAAAVPTGGLSIPFAVAATGARKIGEALTRSQINQLREMILGNSPLAQSRPMIVPPTSKAGKVAAALLLSRNNAPTFSGLVPSYANQNQ